ncbi:MAG: nitroreductase family protein [Acidobacteriota bacterium]
MSDTTSHSSLEYPFQRLAAAEMRRRVDTLHRSLQTRRSIRQFSADPVPRALMERLIEIAGTAPSGANRQPWQWVLVGRPDLKRHIREAAEAEERRNYEGGRFPERWLQVLEPLETDWHKPYLETAPWLVACFRQDYRVRPDGGHENNYYVHESVGIACGFFIAAVHAAGLVTVPHTPSPMGFLAKLLERPAGETPFILFPVGYPAEGARVPDITRKELVDILQHDDGQSMAPEEENDDPAS